MDEGYNPAYGARPLRRAIMRLLEDSMAERMLAGDIKEGDSVIIDGEKLAAAKKVYFSSKQKPLKSKNLDGRYLFDVHLFALSLMAMQLTPMARSLCSMVTRRWCLPSHLPLVRRNALLLLVWIQLQLFGSLGTLRSWNSPPTWSMQVLTTHRSSRTLRS